MTDLDRAAAAWDRAEREGRLTSPAPEPDNRPRDCHNRVITFTPKVTIGGKDPWNLNPRKIS